MRKLLIALALCVFATAPVAAHADTIISILLTNTDPSGNVAGGVGSLTLDAAPLSSNPFHVYTSAGSAGSLLEALSFTIGGDTLTLANAFGSPDAVFENGVLTSVDYFGFGSSFTISLSANGLTYSFNDSNTSLHSNGVISVDTPVPPSPVPEPSTIALLSSGMVGLAGFARRRFSR